MTREPRRRLRFWMVSVSLRAVKNLARIGRQFSAAVRMTTGFRIGWEHHLFEMRTRFRVVPGGSLLHIERNCVVSFPDGDSQTARCLIPVLRRHLRARPGWAGHRCPCDGAVVEEERYLVRARRKGIGKSEPACSVEVRRAGRYPRFAEEHNGALGNRRAAQRQCTGHLASGLARPAARQQGRQRERRDSDDLQPPIQMSVRWRTCCTAWFGHERVSRNLWFFKGARRVKRAKPSC